MLADWQFQSSAETRANLKNNTADHDETSCKRRAGSHLCQLIRMLFLLPLIAVLASDICQLHDTSSLVSATNIVNDADPNSVIIKTHQGQLFRGLRMAGGGLEAGGVRGGSSGGSHGQADVVAFLGVRYASAPVKRLRFMPPTPFNYAKHATGNNVGGAINQSQVHDMRQFGPICMQRFPMEPTREQAWPETGGDIVPADWRAHRSQVQLGLMERLLAPSLYHSWRPIVRKLTSRFVQSEDCLNLNIYTPIEALKREPDQDTNTAANASASQDAPDQQHRNRPVLVVIHGDSFDFGSGSVLDGREFAQNNRVVVITLNYRLHILGFPPRLAGATRANLGLFDQVAALHWIQANVRSFGGSPNKITLMGSKGGAIFVHLLMLSPLAKGLFQRAILEDGTALSPVIANNMALGGGQGAFAASQQRQQVVANQQHSRLLAQLIDCPLARPSLPVGSSNIQQQQQQQQQQTIGLDEERTSLALMIDCFKTKPAEVIMRHLPTELIDTSRPVSSASIPLALRWLRPLEQTVDLLIKEELKSRLDNDANNNNNNNNNLVLDQSGQGNFNSRRNQLGELKRLLAAASNDQSAAVIEARQLNKLIGLMIDRFLQSPMTSTSADVNQQQQQQQQQQQTQRSDEDGKLMVLISEILGAIYLPSNKTLPVGPVFAPQLEPGLIVLADSRHELDLASSMLQRDSPFGRRDLLVGLTHPLVEFNTDEPEQINSMRHVHHQTADRLTLQLAPSLASRKLLELGLTEEQAIVQVNLFVRSFYRYHQQEISNSIVSQYLSKKSNLRPTAGGRLNRFEESATTTLDQQLARLDKQQFLAEAMQALHQDSLVDIPLIKTGLIHALHQLESLADIFVSEQVNKLEAKQQQEEHDDDVIEQLVDERRLEEEFYKFARGLYENLTIWPIRLMPSGRVQDSTSRELFEQRQPHSTFMFQLANKLDWQQTLQATMRKLDERAQQQQQQQQQLASSTGTRVRALLVELIEEASRKDGQASKLEFGCSFIDVIDDDRDDETERSTAFDRFKRWLCRHRIGSKLANFVETGNVNLGPKLQESYYANSIELLSQQFAMDCLNSNHESSEERHNQNALALDDHHLVQLSSSNNRTNFEIVIEDSSSGQVKETTSGRKLDAGCRRRLDELTFEEITLLGTNEEMTDDSQDKWPVFNVFTQQLASLFATQNKLDWSMDSFVSSAKANGQLREAFDGKVAFWANFVTALNCSKTQPIGASSLSLFSQANSTLLNMNLNLNCQQAGTRTASSIIHLLGSRIKHELVQQVSIWRRLQSRNNQSRSQSTIANLSSSQNHHSLRMANMSNNQDNQQQQQQQTSQLEGSELVHRDTADPIGSSGSSFASWLTVDAPNGTRKWFNQQQPSAVFWLLSGSILALMSVLVLGGFVVFRHHWRKRRDEPKRAENQQANKIEELTDWNSTGLLSGTDTAMPASGGESATNQLTKSISFIDCQSANYQQLNGLEHSQPPPPPIGDLNQHYYQHHNQNQEEEMAGLSSELNASQPIQHAYLIQKETDYIDQNGRQEQANSDVTLEASNNQNHLPTCNLILHHLQDHHQQQQQQQQQQLLLSSTSSETTTTQQAHSSGSLVSGSNSNGRRSANKKRVKISDPKRHTVSMNGHVIYQNDVNQAELEPLELNAHQLELIGESPRHFCPIHRSTSNMNLVHSEGQFIVGDTTKFQLLSGHHSLMRNYNHDQQNGQQRALALHPSYQEATTFMANNDHQQQQQQQQVCAAHSFQQRQKQQQVIFANGFYQQHDVPANSVATISSREQQQQIGRTKRNS